MASRTWPVVLSASSEGRSPGPSVHRVTNATYQFICTIAKSSERFLAIYPDPVNMRKVSRDPADCGRYTEAFFLLLSYGQYVESIYLKRLFDCLGCLLGHHPKNLGEYIGLSTLGSLHPYEQRYV